MLRSAAGLWKRTIFYKHKWKFIIGTPILSYGANWKWEDYNADYYLSQIVAKALEEGEKPVVQNELKKMHIILNPMANGGYGRQSYERFAKPIFDCAGYHIIMHKTEYVKHERDIAAEMDPGDILIIAGGDSTVQNVLTALNRRPDFEKDFKNIPIGIIPLGATNSIWHQFSGKDEHSFKKPYTRGMRMVESAQMIIEGHNKPTDVLALTNEDERTIYTLSGFRWGAYYDLEERQSTYWYFPTKALKRRITFLNAYFRGELDEIRSAEISFADAVSESAVKDNLARLENQKMRQLEMMNKVRKSGGFGKGLLGGNRVANPIETKKDEESHLSLMTLKLSELKNFILKEFFEIEIRIVHDDEGHKVSMKFESPFQVETLKNLIIPFNNDLLTTRREDFGRFKDINTEVAFSTDFSFEPKNGVDKFEGSEEKKDFSFYIDGEAYVPCKLKGKLLLDHTNIITRKL